MFDLLLTLALVYFGYRIYQWYQRQKDGVKNARDRFDLGSAPREEARRRTAARDEPVDLPRDDDDFIDYEEVK